MSLGGPVPCSHAPALQQAINVANSRGAIIVVAAGNSNVEASTFSPAGCSGVVTVGATNAEGNRASYSNYGSRIDLMAPGGEPGGLQVVSTLASGQYGGKAGTSMAAPHVAGVLALMKSKKPSLTAAEAISLLKETARRLSAAQCNRPSAGDCGAGLVDARAALQRLNTPPPFAGALGQPQRPEPEHRPERPGHPEHCPHQLYRGGCPQRNRAASRHHPKL